MVDEETESEGKKEWPSKTPDNPPVDDENLTTAPPPDIREKPVEKLEECDPMTMNCNEMPKHMAELTKRSAVLGTGLRKIEEINDTLPSEEGKLLYAKTIEEKSRVDGKIEDIVMRFSKCTLSEEKKEETPETSPES